MRRAHSRHQQVSPSVGACGMLHAGHCFAGPGPAATRSAAARCMWLPGMWTVCMVRHLSQPAPLSTTRPLLTMRIPCTRRTCADQPCTTSKAQEFSLAYGDWAPCDSPCGNQTRSVTCQSKDGYLGSLTDCRESLTSERHSMDACMCVHRHVRMWGGAMSGGCPPISLCPCNGAPPLPPRHACPVSQSSQ